MTGGMERIEDSESGDAGHLRDSGGSSESVGCREGGHGGDAVASGGDAGRCADAVSCRDGSHGADAVRCGALSRKPLVLRSNLVSYLIAGGPLLPQFMGLDPGLDASFYPARGHSPSQMWVASTVTSALGSDTEGLSRLSEEDGGFFLKTLLDSDPALFLGESHARRWGSNPGFLVKLLDSRDRLLVQVHPDKARAKKYFGSEFGKTEAWYVIDALPGAIIHAGFRPGVTKESLREAILEGDSRHILALLHAFPVVPGDVLFIPAGMPHALDSGSLVVEIQEPTDITLRAERKRPSGEILPESFLHAGRGMEALLDCFDYSCVDRASARAGIFLKPRLLRGDKSRGETSLVSRGTTACFSMSAVSVAAGTGWSARNGSFAVGLVLSGEGWLRAGDCRVPLRRGVEFFMPNGVREYSYEAASTDGARAGAVLKILECHPPEADETPVAEETPESIESPRSGSRAEEQ